MSWRNLFGLGLSAMCFVVLTGFDSCSPPLLDNPGFDIWCGDQLCGWEVEAGSIERVATWHERDSGVELKGDPAILSQLVDLTNADATCYVVDLITDTDDRADLVLELDFLDDGEPEYVHPIPANNWEHVHYDLSAPAWYEGVRFRIIKNGPGRARLGQVRVERGEMGQECHAPGPDLLRADGVECAGDAQCASGACGPVRMNSANPDWREQGLICGQCLDDGDCPTGQACALEADEQVWMHRACVPAGLDALGQACASDRECGSDVCCEGRCSECCGPERPCAEDRVCSSAHPSRPDHIGTLMPEMCAPGERDRGAGQACLYATDCQSSSCQGPWLKVCDPDGRRCDQDEDCPLHAFGARCVAVGILDGVCQ